MSALSSSCAPPVGSLPDPWRSARRRQWDRGQHSRRGRRGLPL